MEFPNGTTRLQRRLETPARFSTHSMVTGSVAEEELVEKAVRSAGAIALKWFSGLTFPMNLSRSGSATNINRESTDNDGEEKERKRSQ